MRLRLPLPALVVALLVLVAAASAQARPPVELGTAVNNGGFQGPDARYRSTLALFDVAVGESGFKIAELEPQQGTFAFGLQDQMVAWSAAHGQRFHGSTLVWCDDQWLPGWLLSRSWTPDELRAVMDDFITTVMHHFAGDVQSWDVVNEAFNADGTLRDCLWSRVLGRGYIEEAFQIARAADPGAGLFYNEYKADWVGSKFLAVEDMARDFIARSVPLDGVGLQMHLFGRAPPQYRLEDAMRRIGDLGLLVQVSELDDTTSLFPGTTAEKLDQQAQAYQTVAAACQAQLACRRLTTWGFSDAWSWRGPAEMALPFDAEYRPKPAWDALRRVLRTPAPAPGNHVPGAPGTPSASAAVSRGQFTVTWPAATDADGEPLTYTLEHRDADDADWSTIGSGMRSRSYTFSSTWPEPQGTWEYRVIASDAATDGPPSPVSAPAVVDRSAPRAPVVAGDRPADADGAWFADAVTLDFTSAGDPPLLDGSPGSGVDPASLPPSVPFTTAGPHTVTGTVRDLAGNVSAAGSGTASVDAAPPVPTISALAAGLPYLAGAWAAQPVTVRLTCTDDGAGVASTDPDAVVSAEGAGQERTAACRDRVGHTASATFGPVAIDVTPPAAPSRTVVASPGAPVTLTADAVDPPGGSGVDPASIVWSDGASAPRTGDRATYAFGEPGDHVVALRFADRAGNTGAATVTVAVRAAAATRGVSVAGPQPARRTTCTVRRATRRTVVTCAVARTGAARLSRGGRTVARGRVGSGGRLVLTTHRRLRPGAYRLTVGGTAVTIRLR